MPRRPRYFEEGYVYHVIQRGNNKGQIFFQHEDYLVFLRYLLACKKEFPCYIYGYCLMMNHLHFLIEAVHTNNISLLMKTLTGTYARYINSKYNRTGALYEGRFKAALVQYETYFMNCLRYIDLNPIRANLVKSPELYPWSSYNFNTRAEPSKILDYHSLYLCGGKGIEECRIKYKEFVQSQPEEKSIVKLIRDRTNKGGVIGTDNFIEELKLKKGIDRTCYTPGRPVKKGSDTIKLSTELSTINCV
jgi:putative transposase